MKLFRRRKSKSAKRRRRPEPKRRRRAVKAVPTRRRRAVKLVPALRSARDAGLRGLRETGRRVGRAGRLAVVPLRPLARLARRAARLLRPLPVLALRGLGVVERALRAVAARLRRIAARIGAAATRASAVLTPSRALAAVVLGSAACLAVSQFVDYHGVEIGQPGYVGLPAAAPPPTVDLTATGQAHLYLMLPVALLAALLALLAWRHPERRRLGAAIAVLGLLGVATSLIVDLPKGLDAGGAAVRFAGAAATLENGFYAQLAASAAMLFSGLVISLGPRRLRRRASRPLARRRRRRSRRRAPLAEGRT